MIEFDKHFAYTKMSKEIFVFLPNELHLLENYEPHFGKWGLDRCGSMKISKDSPADIFFLLEYLNPSFIFKFHSN